MTEKVEADSTVAERQKLAGSSPSLSGADPVAELNSGGGYLCRSHVLAPLGATMSVR